MTTRPTLLYISGSARRHSSNSALLKALASVTTDIADCRLYGGLATLPIFSPDLEGDATPAPVLELVSAVAAAEGLVIACPEYAHGIPGGMKNLLDWLVSREAFVDKPVMLVWANGHGRGAHVRAALAEVLRTMNARLLIEDGASIYLVAKTPEAIAEILHSGENRALLWQAVQRFIEELGGRE